MNIIDVHFINSGWGNDHGTRAADLVNLTIDPMGKPVATIKNPFDYYTAELIAVFLNDEWVCDLD